VIGPTEADVDVFDETGLLAVTRRPTVEPASVERSV
jgi:hypothetical protein